MYLIFGAVLSIAALSEITGKKRAATFIVLYAIMTIMLCLRYGQGTDYNNYYLQYNYINVSTSLLKNSLYHGELGWYILMMVLKKAGCSFYSFIAIISTLMMIGIYKAINNFSKLHCISLLLLYPTYYLTFMYSAIRQGLVLCLFLGFGLEYLQKKLYIRYYILITILILFHTSAIILLLLPLLSKLKGKKPENWLIFALVLMGMLGYTGVYNIIANTLGVQTYLSVSISIPAIVVRLLLGFLIYKMHIEIRKHEEDDIETFLYHFYLIGLVFFMMLSFAGTLSQRVTMPLKAIEVLLIPNQISILSKLKQNGDNIKVFSTKLGRVNVMIIPIIIIAIFNYELLKNINSYIIQGNYYDWVNAFNYPYICIFNKDRIFDYISHFD